MMEILYQIEYDLPVWKLVFDPHQPMIGVEIRQNSSKQAEFFFHDIADGKLASQHRSQLDDWWVEINQISNGLVIFNGFQGEEMPEINGYEVFDPQNEKTLALSKEGAAMEFDENSQILKIQKGNKIEDIPISMDFQNKKEIELNEPLSYPESSEFFSTFSEFILKEKGHEARENIEYMEHHGSVIISYYIYSDTKLDNYLMVVEENGNIPFHELISKGRKGIGYNTFYLYDQKLLFIDQETKMTVCQL